MKQTDKKLYDHGYAIYREDDFAFRYAASDDNQSWLLVGGPWNKTPNRIIYFRTAEEIDSAITLLNRMKADMLQEQDEAVIMGAIEEAASAVYKDLKDSEFYSLRMRACNGVLRHLNRKDVMKNYRTDHQLIGTKYFATMKDEEMTSIRNVGVKTLKILVKAQQLAQLYLESTWK